MTGLKERLIEISKIEDPLEQGERMIALLDEMIAGPWAEVMAQTASAEEAEAAAPDSSAEAEEEKRRTLDTIVNRAMEEAEQLFPPRRTRVPKRRSRQLQI